MFMESLAAGVPRLLELEGPIGKPNRSALYSCDSPFSADGLPESSTAVDKKSAIRRLFSRVLRVPRFATMRKLGAYSAYRLPSP
jgi:hypothetical protein